MYPPVGGIESIGSLIVSDADSGILIDAHVKDGEFTVVDVIHFLCRQMVEHGRPDAPPNIVVIATRSTRGLLRARTASLSPPFQLGKNVGGVLPN